MSRRSRARTKRRVMGEEVTPFSVEFNGSLRIESRAERLTAEAGAVILREVAERLGIVPWMVERLHDPRNPRLSIPNTPSAALWGGGERDAIADPAAESSSRTCGPTHLRHAARSTAAHALSPPARQRQAARRS